MLVLPADHAIEDVDAFQRAVEGIGQVFHHHGAVTAVEADRSTATKGILPVPHHPAGQGARCATKGWAGRIAILFTKGPAVIRSRRGLRIQAGCANEHKCSYHSRCNETTGHH